LGDGLFEHHRAATEYHLTYLPVNFLYVTEQSQLNNNNSLKDEPACHGNNKQRHVMVVTATHALFAGGAGGGMRVRQGEG